MLDNRAKFFSVLLLTAGFAVSAWGSSVVTDFVADQHGNTNQWDWGSATYYDKISSTTANNTLMLAETGAIVSPLYAAPVTNLTVTLKAVNQNTDNKSRFVVSGRAAVTDDWTELGATETSGSKFDWGVSVAAETDFRQFQFRYEKASGTLRIYQVVAQLHDGQENPPPDEPSVPPVLLWRMSEVLKGGRTERFVSLPAKSFDWTNNLSVCGIALGMDGEAAGRVTEDSGKSNASGFFTSRDGDRHALSLLARGSKTLSLFLSVTNDTASTVVVSRLDYTACQWTNNYTVVTEEMQASETKQAKLACSFAVVEAVDDLVASAFSLGAAWGAPCDAAANFTALVDNSVHHFAGRSAAVDCEVAPGQVFVFQWKVVGGGHFPMFGVTDIALAAAKKSDGFVLSVK